jgi:uncharacterized protein YkwD
MDILDIRELYMKKIGGIVFMILFSAAVCAAEPAGNWSYGDYDDYNYETFSNYGPARQRINFDNIDYPLLHAAVFYETNRMRAANGLSVFKHSPALERAAFGHSRDMVEHDFFSHYSPLSGKRDLQDRLALVGIRNTYMAENIAYTFGIEYEAGRGVYNPAQNGGYFSYSYKGDPILNHSYLGLASEVVTQWMNSPGHRRNILNRNYIFLGAGAAHYSERDFYHMDQFKFTQNFAAERGKDFETLTGR